MRAPFQSKGFTLIEMLMVLAIFMTLILIALPINSKVTDRIEAKRFFSQLENDVLYMQSLSITKAKQLKLYIYPNSHFYELREGGLNKLFLRRDFSEQINMRIGSIDIPFYFNTTGTPNKPGTFYVDIKDDTYLITFPFGRGRYYVTKQ